MGRRVSRARAGTLTAVTAAAALAALTVGPQGTAPRAAAEPAATGATASGTTETEMEPAATSQPVRWTEALADQAPCPEGRTRRATLLDEHFSRGIPQADFANGWSVVSRSLDGRAARSVVSGSDTEDWFFAPWVQAPVGAQTMLAFASRGTVPASGYSRADVNSVSTRVAANGTRWQGRVFDVTAATRDEDGRLGTWFQHRSRAGTTQWWEVDNVQLYTCRAAAVSRIEGSDRYATSAAVAAQYRPGQDVVYLASGHGFADALSGGALAARDGAPVLLVRTDAIPAPVAAQLTRLSPTRIVVLGGATAVGDAVLEAARAYTDGSEESVVRLAGADRYATSAAVTGSYPAGVGTVWVASGRSFPDGLSGGAAAGRQGSPLLLTSPVELLPQTQEALDRLAPADIVVLGGPAAVPEAVVDQLRAHTTGTVTRLAGSDRHETSALVADTFPRAPERVFLATGAAFPDALSGSALAGKEAAPVLLTRASRLPADVGSALDRLDAGSGVVLGGYTAVQSTVLDQLGQHVG
ncbi:cell wall-binding repeat-containing protein [Ornithinimicrobium avium]|uniref:Cell wall-binding repeat-containing protein n=1 Tax=Ornithinimicrobium avium TaxID=2283195 RepID=A0A345NQ76_9MICO|nr:cell wall-binding repeat-containing protein [Ornithinimicrobium avium]AXH97184.1 cell wall-binding repeat-containing protein [Ornithinimicrobium avium]